MSKVPMTPFGKQQLDKELEHLKNVQRPQIAKTIGEARELGDLKENAEYHAAKDRQGLTEARIRYLEDHLSNAQIIDVTTIDNTGKVIFGTTTTLLNINTNDEVTYQIVGEDEANLQEGKISVSSPVARALIGKMEDDEVIVDAPDGEIEYEIVKVDHL